MPFLDILFILGYSIIYYIQYYILLVYLLCAMNLYFGMCYNASVHQPWKFKKKEYRTKPNKNFIRIIYQNSIKQNKIKWLTNN